MSSEIERLFGGPVTSVVSAMGRSALGRSVMVLPALAMLWIAVAWAVSLP